MSRFVRLDSGEELSDATVGSLRSAPGLVRLRLREPAPPFRDGQVVNVRPVEPGAGRARDVLLCRAGGEFSLCLRRDAPVNGEVLGRVVAIERGAARVSVERGLLALLPARWLPRAVDALEVVARFRRPLTPPLFQGGAEISLAGVREKYDSAAEVRQYAQHAEEGAVRFELEIVERHVKPGGRLLDVGCGAGREAIGFARAGFGVVAIDLAPGMVEAAREHARREGLAIEFRVQSATEIADPPGSFDGVFCTGAVYNHLPGRALRVETLRRIGRALAPGGALLLGVGYRRPLGLVSRTRVVDFLRVLGAKVFGPGRFSEPGDGWMRAVSEASDSRAPVFFHDFAGPGDVRGEFEAAGLSATEVAPAWWVCRPIRR